MSGNHFPVFGDLQFELKRLDPNPPAFLVMSITAAGATKWFKGIWSTVPSSLCKMARCIMCVPTCIPEKYSSSLHPTKKVEIQV
ncbi:hypothetical protein TNCV_625111 [Trichonephila clavipes]|nr:hypothetical protein TNCV_625111 [Trichonephila clavipes]